ncbi:MAG TPA: hypothetical protein PKV19_08845, partial [Anaerolineales bacterium]|nr:hypothetical protein [Anaerolineales bacterium]
MFRPFFSYWTSGNANLRYAVAFANPFTQRAELRIYFLELKFIGHYDSPLDPKKTTRVFAFMPR